MADESATKAENRARNAVLFVSCGMCRAKMTQPGGKFCRASDACGKRALLGALVTLSAGAGADAVGIGAAGVVEQEDPAMRPSRVSRYSTYSACNASQRSFESVRKPALRASRSSADNLSSSPSALGLFSRLWYGKWERRYDASDGLENVTRANPLHFGTASGGSW